MSETTKTPFTLELIYTATDAKDDEMKLLSDELTSRGHAVTLSKWNDSNIPDIISRSAKDITQTVKSVAESTTKVIREAIDSYLPKASAETAKDANKAEEAEGEKKTADEKAENAPADEDNSAVIVTNEKCLKRTSNDMYKIALIPHTELTQTWNASRFDAIVSSHKAFRSYLEYVHWAPERIFEGGWLTTTKSSDTPENIRTKFGLSREAGPIIMVMAQNIPSSDLQTIMLQFSLIRTPYQAFFYYGDSSMNADTLRNLASRFNVNARMFGTVTPMADYLAIADMVICTPEDKLLPEVEALGIPSIIIAENTLTALPQLLVHENAAVSVAHTYELASVLARYVDQPEMLNQLAAKAAEIASHASVKECADAIEAALSAKATLAKKTPDAKAAFAGFETIGTVQTTAPSATSFLKPSAQNASPFEQLGAPAQQPQMQAPYMPYQATPQIPTAYMPPTTAPASTMPPAVAPIQPTIAPVQPSITPTFAPSHKAYKDIHAEYTNLLVVEKDLDRSLDAAGAEVAKWEERLDLARKNNNDYLVNEAMMRLKSAQVAEMSLFQQKDQLMQQKALLKQSAQQARAGAPITSTPTFIDDEFSSKEDDPLEKEFKAMQQKNRLQNLKNLMGLR